MRACVHVYVYVYLGICILILMCMFMFIFIYSAEIKATTLADELRQSKLDKDR